MESQDDTPKELLDYFFDFTNFNISTLNQDNLPWLAMTYVRFAFFNDGGKSSAKYSTLTSAAFNSSGNAMEKTKDFLEQLQKYFRGILDQIINSSGPGLSLKQKGTRVVNINDGKFVESFMTENPPMDGFNLELEKQYAEASLTDIFINESLEPTMFNRCQACGNYFYQKTKREMKFCTQRCSNTHRQRVFQTARIKKTPSNKTQYLRSESGTLIGIGVGPLGPTKEELDRVFSTMERMRKKEDKK